MFSLLSTQVSWATWIKRLSTTLHYTSTYFCFFVFLILAFYSLTAYILSLFKELLHRKWMVFASLLHLLVFGALSSKPPNHCLIYSGIYFYPLFLHIVSKYPHNAMSTHTDRLSVHFKHRWGCVYSVIQRTRMLCRLWRGCGLFSGLWLSIEGLAFCWFEYSEMFHTACEVLILPMLICSLFYWLKSSLHY